MQYNKSFLQLIFEMPKPSMSNESDDYHDDDYQQENSRENEDDLTGMDMLLLLLEGGIQVTIIINTMNELFFK